MARLGRGDDADLRPLVECQVQLASLGSPAQIERQVSIAGDAQLIETQDTVAGGPAIGRTIWGDLLVVGLLDEELIAVVTNGNDICAGVQPQQRHIGSQQQQRRDNEGQQVIEPVAATERQR